MKKRIISSLIVWAGWLNTAQAQAKPDLQAQHVLNPLTATSLSNCSGFDGKVTLNGNPSSRILAANLELGLAWPHLQYAFEQARNKVQDLQLLQLTHEQNSYQLHLMISQLIFWDTFQLNLNFPSENTLRIQLRDNWIPSSLILNRLHSRIKSALDNQPVQISQQPDAIELKYLAATVQLNSSSSLAAHTLNAQIEADGSLKLILSSPLADGSNNQITSQQKVCGNPTETLAYKLSTQVDLDLKPDDLRPISLGSEKLIERVQATKGQLGITGQGELKLEPVKMQADGQLKIQLEQLEVEHKTYKQIQAVPFQWHYSFPDQLKIYPLLPPVQPVRPALTANQLQLFSDGPSYQQEMFKVISEARKSVEQEIFAFHAGRTTRALTRLYILKALGLQDSSKGLQPDSFAPEGIRVFLLHNHHLTFKGSREVQQIFDLEANQIFQELSAKISSTALQAHRERLRQNLRITPLTDGVAHSDHRKLLLIDGKMAYTGGRNIGDNYLTEDAFRDLMIRVEGPVVHDMQQAFIDNWQSLTPYEKVNWNLHSASELAAALPQTAKLSPSTILTTSSRGWQIQAAMLDLIQRAQQTIRLEYAYLYHEPIEDALRAAKARGVEIQLLFSERSDESLFDHLNPASALDLMQAPGPGKVRTWLWQGHGGEHDYMVHTKFMSVDGKQAIVGSANLIPRSLQSPFTAEGKPLLFNEEMVLYIEDEHFVQTLDYELFNKDRNLSREYQTTDLAKLLEQRGGQLQLLIEKLKGLLA